MKRIHSRFVSAATGRRDRSRTSSLAQARNFDWRRTLKANLSRWDPGLKRLGIDRPRFNARVNRSFPWDIVLLVDQSGSMASSVIYAAVTAGILNSLPAVRTRLVAFDTSIVDLSSIARDPVEVLMSVSLGGGTDIGKALGYASTLIGDPRRTIVALISDFSEGASPGTMLAQARTLASAGVRLLGIAALDDEANPVYDRAMAERLADRGMEIAALTPLAFADWLGSVMG
jgi:Mg-chelatase subunit ChlD